MENSHTTPASEPYDSPVADEITPGPDSPSSGSAEESGDNSSPVYKYVTLSFIRHGQSEANILNSTNSNSDLTAFGRRQAETLGKLWSDVRIDALYSSPMIRALLTAQELASQNKGWPSIIREPNLIEQDLGPVFDQYLRQGNHWGANSVKVGPTGRLDRSHTPTGGESLMAVESRCRAVVDRVVSHHAIQTPPPKEFEDTYRRTGNVDEIPEGIPHVVLVGHNVCLAEFYELLLSWNEPVHIDTSVNYSNTGWSRHILRIGDDDSFMVKHLSTPR